MLDHYPVNKIVPTTRPNRHGNLASSSSALSKSTAHTTKSLQYSKTYTTQRQNSPARARRKLRFHSLIRSLAYFPLLLRAHSTTLPQTPRPHKEKKRQTRLPPPIPHHHDDRETIIREPLSQHQNPTLLRKEPKR